MNIYSVINMDIVKSRDIINRKDAQDSLKKFIQKINKENKDLLLAPITFTLGDEWQIVLKRPFESYRIIDKFQSFLRKYEIGIYIGIGVGKISTNIYEDTRLMDGECFIRAREALGIVKNKNRFYNENLNSKENNVYFNAEKISFEKIYDGIREIASTSDKDYWSEDKTNSDIIPLDINTIINTIIENTEVLKSKITGKQMKTIELYRKEGSYSNMIKKNDNISKSSISQKLNDSNYFLIESNKNVIYKLLKLYCQIREGN